MSALPAASKAAHVAARHNRSLWRVHAFKLRRLTAGLHRGSRERHERVRTPRIKRSSRSRLKCSGRAETDGRYATDRLSRAAA